MIRAAAVWGLLFFLGTCSTLQAHDLGIARVSLEAGADNSFTVEALLPSTVEATVPTVPERCEQQESTRRSSAAGNIDYRWQFACAGAALGGTDIIILEWAREGAFVGLKSTNGISQGHFFDEEEGRIVIEAAQVLRPTLGAWQAVKHYFTLGVEHILGGWDHLAFVLTLCLLASGWQLVRLVTAFTVGHSITLALAVLGWISVWVPPVEACIALSIAFMAREVILKRHASLDATLIVLSFGLLHGLGFASALRDSGFEHEHLFAALLMFNLGVEIGQLLFVAAVIMLAWVLQRVYSSSNFKRPLAVALGAMGMFWAFQRVAGFWA